MGDKLHPNFKSLFDSDKLSDATIQCGSRSFKVHAAILTAASTYFEGAFAGVFKESATRVIDLKDDDEEAVLAMLRFLYNHSYEDCYYACSYSESLFDAKMYILGDKYDLPELRARSKDDFSQAVMEGALSEMGLDDAKSVLDLAYHGLPDSNRSLRESLLEAVVARGNDFWTIDGEDSSAELFAQYPQFATEVVRKYVDRMAFLGKRQADQYICPHCNLRFRMSISFDIKDVDADRHYDCPSCFESSAAERWAQARVEIDDENSDYMGD
ncbi:hypothetical protein MBLNU457_5062t2 [Dothideomycetes sp. NU457]